MLFGMNALGGPWNIVLDGGPDPPTVGGRGSRRKILLTYYISQKWLKLEKFGVLIEHWGLNKNYAKVDYRGSGHVTHF